MWQPTEDGRRALLKDEGEAAATGGPLQEYSNEFLRLRALAATRLQSLREGAGAGCAWGDEVRAAERTLEEMESTRRLVQVQVRLELSGAVGNPRQEWDQRLQEWAREATALRGQLEELREDRARHTLRLPSAGRGQDTAPGAEQRCAARGSTEMLERSSRQLEEARRVALETEGISEGVMSDLAAQRDTILHMKDSMRTVDAELSAARQSLNRMILMAQRNRVMTLAIAAVLSLGLAFWALSVMKLPLKWNFALAAAVVVLGAVCIVLRRRCLRQRSG